MKIAIYCNLPLGGGKRIITGLVNELHNRGHKITLYAGNQLNIKTSKIKTIKLGWLTPKTTKDYLKLIYSEIFKKTKRLAQKIDNEDYNFILLGGDWVTNTSLLPIFLRTQKISIVHELKREFYEKTQSNFLNQIKGNIWNILTQRIRKLEIISLNRTDKIIANSMYSSIKLKKIINSPDKVKIIYPFIDKKFFNQRFSNQAKFNLLIGNNYYLKGIDFVLDVIKNIPKTLQKPLRIITTKDNKRRIKKEIRRKNIEVLSRLNDKELINSYLKAKLVLYFPRKEPYGLIPTEALVLKCPVLAINEGGFTEIVSKSQNAKLIPRNKNLLKNEIMKYNQKRKEWYKDNNFMKNVVNKRLTVKNYTDRLLEVVK